MTSSISQPMAAAKRGSGVVNAHGRLEARPNATRLPDVSAEGDVLETIGSMAATASQIATPGAIEATQCAASSAGAGTPRASTRS